MFRRISGFSPDAELCAAGFPTGFVCRRIESRFNVSLSKPNMNPEDQLTEYLARVALSGTLREIAIKINEIIEVKKILVFYFDFFSN